LLPKASRQGHGFTRLADVAERISYRNFRILVGNNFDQNPVGGRIELVIHFVGLQFDERLSLSYFLALSFEPFDDDHLGRRDSTRFRNSERGDYGDPPASFEVWS
jgi:hypothetical protein